MHTGACVLNWKYVLSFIFCALLYGLLSFVNYSKIYWIIQFHLFPILLSCFFSCLLLAIFSHLPFYPSSPISFTYTTTSTTCSFLPCPHISRTLFTACSLPSTFHSSLLLFPFYLTLTLSSFTFTSTSLYSSPFPSSSPSFLPSHLSTQISSLAVCAIMSSAILDSEGVFGMAGRPSDAGN